MPIAAFCGRVFAASGGADRSAWVTRFALTLAGNGDEEFAASLLDEAAGRMKANRERQARFRAKKAEDGEKHFGDAPQGGRGEAGASGFATSPSISQERPGKSANDLPQNATGGSGGDADGQAIVPGRRPQGRKEEKRKAFGSAKNVMMTDAEHERLQKEYGDVDQMIEELSDYILLHPQKYRDHYAALRTWCRRRRQEGRNPDGTRMTQGDRLARYFANREQEIIHEHHQAQ